MDSIQVVASEEKTRRGRLFLLGVVGAAGAACIAFATDLPGSRYGAIGASWPFAFGGSARGWEGPRVPSWAGVANSPVASSGRLLPLFAALCGVGLVCVAWVWLLRRTTRAHLRPQHLSAALAAWVAPLLFAAPFASQDVWGYGAQGQAVLSGLSPSSPAGVLGHSIWLAGADPRTIAEPALYGPSALGLSALFVRLSGGRPWLAVEYWRVVAVAALAFCAWAITRGVRRAGGNTPSVILLGVANPGLLVMVIASIHNDAVFMAFVVAGVALVNFGRSRLGLVACAVALSFKAPAAVALLAVVWHGWPRSVRGRVRGLVTAAVVAGVTLALVGLAVGGGFGWLRAGATPSEVRSVFALMLPFGGAGLLQLAGLGLSCLVVLQGRSSGGWLRSLAIALFVLAATSATVQPWYLSWSLILLAADGVARRGQHLLASSLIVMMTWSELPAGVILWKLGLAVLSVGMILSQAARAGRREPDRPLGRAIESARAWVSGPSGAPLLPGARRRRELLGDWLAQHRESATERQADAAHAPVRTGQLGQ